jgi:hypothetical protein
MGIEAQRYRRAAEQAQQLAEYAADLRVRRLWVQLADAYRHMASTAESLAIAEEGDTRPLVERQGHAGTRRTEARPRIIHAGGRHST